MNLYIQHSTPKSSSIQPRTPDSSVKPILLEDSSTFSSADSPYLLSRNPASTENIRDKNNIVEENTIIENISQYDGSICITPLVRNQSSDTCQNVLSIEKTSSIESLLSVKPVKNFRRSGNNAKSVDLDQQGPRRFVTSKGTPKLFIPCEEAVYEHMNEEQDTPHAFTSIYASPRNNRTYKKGYKVMAEEPSPDAKDKTENLIYQRTTTEDCFLELTRSQIHTQPIDTKMDCMKTEFEDLEEDNNKGKAYISSRRDNHHGSNLSRIQNDEQIQNGDISFTNEAQNEELTEQQRADYEILNSVRSRSPLRENINSRRGSNEIESGASAIELIPAEQVVIDNNDNPNKFEAEIYLKRAISLIIVVFIMSLLTLLKIDSTSYGQLSTLCYLYLLYSIVEGIIRIIKPQRENWRITEDIFDVLDAICGLLFLLCVDLKRSEIISISLISSIPFVGTFIAYCSMSEAPPAAKMKNNTIKIYYIVQVIMISAKLDELFNLSWIRVFAFTYIFLFGVTVHQAIYFAKVFQIIRNILFKRINRGNRTRIHLTGTFWYLLYYSLKAMGLISLFPVYLIGNKYRHNLVVGTASTCLSLCILLLLYMALTFKSLTKFIQAKQSSVLQVNLNPVTMPINPMVRRHQVNFEVEKKESYFVMLSTTYFRSLDADFLSKGTEKVKQRIKNTLSSLVRPKSKFSRQSDQNGNQNQRPVKQIQASNELPGQTSNKMTPHNKRVYSMSIVPKGDTSRQQENDESMNKKDSDASNSLDNQAKINFSADDLAAIKDGFHNIRSNRALGEDKICYLCYDNIPDAILMSCKHGGICYECAVALVKKNNICMECRTPVEAIVKIDPSPKLFDIMRGVQVTKVIKTEMS